MNKEGYTIEKIVSDNLYFEIPLYQRLFEWQEAQITQLINDLYSEYKKAPNAPYYIGMLTSKSNAKGRLDLIDGQQRMTVLVLMGIVFGWDKFLSSPQKMRLSFFARPKDEEYLKSLIDTGAKCDYVNVNMQRGIGYINAYLAKELMSEDEKKSFGEYIYENLTLFIYNLPDDYDQSDLNRYFESMNSTGKSLENHEILKVKLLKKLPDDSSKTLYNRIWNAVADMDKPLLRMRNYKVGGYTENAEEFQARCRQSIAMAIHRDEIFKFFDKERGKSLINDFYKNGETTEILDDRISIGGIAPSDTPPSKSMFSRDNRSFLSFPEFLLEVLYLTLNQEIGDRNVTDFFNVHKLQETFNFFQDKFDADKFIRNLLVYRLLFDMFCIRVNNEDSGYSLENFSNADLNNPTLKEYQNAVIQYQSMLYVSSTTLTYYQWVAPLLRHLHDSVEDKKWPDAEELLQSLKDDDNHRHDASALTLDSLKYGIVDRYWFWRLDYYLWENREDCFSSDKYRPVADNYVFRTGRSIEHVAPQTPQRESSLKWEENNKQDINLRDCFGNLAMISSSQNSSLRNESFEVKKAYVESFVRASKTGSVESLKLLKIFNDFGTWSKDNIRKHADAMLKFLQETAKQHELKNV